jgi:threonine dehydrogenase-like Zn-dependent dehydrogenase
MKACCWYGKNDVRVETVPDPQIRNPHDAIVKVNLTAICGSDLHLMHGAVPSMEPGDILGHEFMGEVMDVGPGNQKLKRGDRVVAPFTIACGKCFYCHHDLWSLCDNSNPNAVMLEKVYGFSGSGLFGYSHLYGGYAGGQAEYVRVPFADVGLFPIPDSVDDEHALFLSDIFPTGYQAAENCSIEPGDTIAVWGCGPVGQFAIRSAFLLGAERVIAIDDVPERLHLAERAGAETINYDHTDVIETLKIMTGGRGPDGCIDAVGFEAHGATLPALYDEVKYRAHLETDKPIALREAIQACRKGGTVSIPGVYAGFVDQLPIGAAFAKGLTLKMGQTQVQKYMGKLMRLVDEGKIDPTFVITHRLSLRNAAEGYDVFDHKKDSCVKVVMRP